MIARLKNEWTIFLIALQFLTRAPTPRTLAFSPDRLTAAVRYYPAVGLLIGAVVGFVFWAAAIVFPPLIAVLLSTAAGVLLTGAFHEDGLADTFDGVGGGVDAEKALAIMKDSRIGAYGALALGLVMAVKIATLTILAESQGAFEVVVMMMAAHSLSRLSAVAVIASSRYVRDVGTGKPTASGVSALDLWVAALTGFGAFAAAAVFAAPPILLAGAAGLVCGHVAMRVFFERKIKGYTGDTLGATQQLSEVGFYLGLSAWASS